MSYKIWCLVKGLTEPLAINTLPETTIFDLREEIHKLIPFHKVPDLPATAQVLAFDLALFKSQVHNEHLDTIRDAMLSGRYQPAPEASTRLREVWYLVSEIWPEIPPMRDLHIFIDFDFQISGRKRIREETSATVDAEDLAIKRFRSEIEKKAPSYLAEPLQFVKIVGKERSINMDRPFDPGSTPIELLDDSFGNPSPYSI
ncbi:hypothetical protein BGW80DRAFT_1254779 [Lactifluus volemus]|nr:hypothetical protein BGW80DRAFT_1259727 [Lactifluus volemus]KAH9966389.1 hypothetical protein BGW80DRAFT_1254779 [Lactifluus volemus]